MARSRNRVVKLPAELQDLVALALIEHVPYDEIRAQLVAAGVTGDDLPSNSSFLNYEQGPEYRAAQEQIRHWRTRAGHKRLLARAIQEGGGLMGAADIALAEAVEQLTGEIVSGEGDVARAASAVVQIKRAILAEQEARNARLVAELRTRLAAQERAAQERGQTADAVDLRQIADTMARLLE